MKLKSELFDNIPDLAAQIVSVVLIADHRLEIFEEEDGTQHVWLRVVLDDDKHWANKKIWGRGRTLYDQLWSLREKVDTIAEAIGIFKGYGTPEYQRLKALEEGLQNFQVHEHLGEHVPSYIGPPTYERIDAA